MMWSSVPKVRSGMRTLSLSSFSIWKACGVVTSWMRWRPIRSWVWPDGSVRTVCASHTLSSSVRAMGFLLLREAHPAPALPCSLVKGSSLNGKLRLTVNDRRRPLPRAGDPARGGAHRLGGGGGAPAPHHVLGGEPADPAARGPLRREALRARGARRAPLCRGRGGGASDPRAMDGGGGGLRPAHGARRALGGDDSDGGERLSRQGPPRAGAARSPRRGSAHALRDRHRPLARGRAAGRGGRGGPGRGDRTGDPARAGGAPSLRPGVRLGGPAPRTARPRAADRATRARARAPPRRGEPRARRPRSVPG